MSEQHILSIIEDRYRKKLMTEHPEFKHNRLAKEQFDLMGKGPRSISPSV